MITKLIALAAMFLAACIVMILHELPKSIAYIVLNPYQGQKDKKYIFKILQYIDPIGVIFFVTCGAGFSKPYMYRIKDKKTNYTLGVTGFLSNLLFFLLNIGLFVVVKSHLPSIINDVSSYSYLFVYTFVYYMAFYQLTMLIVNCFPISTFDLGLIIAAKSPSKYFSLLQKDYFVKLILMIAIFMRIVTQLAYIFFPIRG